MNGACSRHERDRKCLVGRSERSRPLGRRKRRRQDNIRMDLSVIEWQRVD
jgi:hypothetical protein